MRSLAKPYIDVGLFTNQLEAMLTFYQKDCGLPFEEMLPIGSGIRQHRHSLNGSVLKLNHSRHPLAERGAGGYSELLVATPDLLAPKSLSDHDGNRVSFVPPGSHGVNQIGLRIGVADQNAHARFWTDALNARTSHADGYPVVEVGESVLILEPQAGEASDRSYPTKGISYITIQVWDVDIVHKTALSQGASEGFPPKTLGDVARISFIRDPDGNWIELSQRASLTGPLS